MKYLIFITLLFISNLTYSQTYLESEDILTEIDLSITEFTPEFFKVEFQGENWFLEPSNIDGNSIVCKNKMNLTILLEDTPIVALTRGSSEDIIWFTDRSTIRQIINVYGDLLEHQDKLVFKQIDRL